MMKFPTEWKVIKAMFQTTNQSVSESLWGTYYILLLNDHPGSIRTRTVNFHGPTHPTIKSPKTQKDFTSNWNRHFEIIRNPPFSSMMFPDRNLHI
jgi:hypothetical protein